MIAPTSDKHTYAHLIRSRSSRHLSLVKFAINHERELSCDRYANKMHDILVDISI